MEDHSHGLVHMDSLKNQENESSQTVQTQEEISIDTLRRFDKEFVERAFTEQNQEGLSVDTEADPDLLIVGALAGIERALVIAALSVPEESIPKIVVQLREYLISKISSLPRLSYVVKSAKACSNHQKFSKNST